MTGDNLLSHESPQKQIIVHKIRFSIQGLIVSNIAVCDRQS